MRGATPSAMLSAESSTVRVFAGCCSIQNCSAAALASTFHCSHQATSLPTSCMRSVMDDAERDGPFIADLAAHGARLHEPEMVRLRGCPAANETGLRCDVFQMVGIAQPARRGDRQVCIARFGGGRRLLCRILRRLCELQPLALPLIVAL